VLVVVMPLVSHATFALFRNSNADILRFTGVFCNKTT
jgi:hypothetical protein